MIIVIVVSNLCFLCRVVLYDTSNRVLESWKIMKSRHVYNMWLSYMPRLVCYDTIVFFPVLCNLVFVCLITYWTKAYLFLF